MYCGVVDFVFYDSPLDQQHLGGIHSGCAVSGIIWLTYKVVNTYRNHVNEHNAILTLGLATNIAVIVTAIAAFPWVRNTHHK